MDAAQIIADLEFLQASAAAARPLKQAAPLVKAALLNAGTTLVTEVDMALAVSVGVLDDDDPTGYAGAMVDDLLALSVAADNQACLADMRGTIGRAVFNMAQLF